MCESLWTVLNSVASCIYAHFCPPFPSAYAFHAVKLNNICLNSCSCNPPSLLYYSTCLSVISEKMKFKERKDISCPLPRSKSKSIFVNDIFDIISTFWSRQQLLLTFPYISVCISVFLLRLIIKNIKLFLSETSLNHNVTNVKVYLCITVILTFHTQGTFQKLSVLQCWTCNGLCE